MIYEPRIELFLRELVNSSERERAAIAWLIDNFALAEEICGAEALTDEQRRTLRKWGEDRKDSLLPVLLAPETVLHRDFSGLTDDEQCNKVFWENSSIPKTETEGGQKK